MCFIKLLSPPFSRNAAEKWPRLEAQMRAPSYMRHQAIGWSAPMRVTPVPTL